MALHAKAECVADIFISHKSERRKAVQHLAEILKINGYPVWFDSGLHSGVDFSARIEKQLEAASVVLTLWCKLSVNSEWVKEETHCAKRAGKAIPALIEPVDLPFGFGLSDTINLAKWDGSPRSEALYRLFQQNAQKTGKKRQPDMEALTLFEEPWRRHGSPTLAQFALVHDGATQEAGRARSGLAKLTSRMGKPKEGAAPSVDGASGGVSPLVWGGGLATLAAGQLARAVALPPVPDHAGERRCAASLRRHGGLKPSRMRRRRGHGRESARASADPAGGWRIPRARTVPVAGGQLHF